MAVNFDVLMCVNYPPPSYPPLSSYNASLPSFPSWERSCRGDGLLSNAALTASIRSCVSDPGQRIRCAMASHRQDVNPSQPPDQSTVAESPQPILLQLTPQAGNQINEDNLTGDRIDRYLSQYFHRTPPQEDTAYHRSIGGGCFRTTSQTNVNCYQSLTDYSRLSVDPRVDGTNVVDGAAHTDVERQHTDETQVGLLDKAELVLESLQRNAQCTEVNCCDKACAMGRHLFELTEKMLRKGTALKSSLARNVLHIVAYDHAASCYEPACVIPWCSFFYEDRNDEFDDLIILLMKEMYMKQGFTSFFDFNSEDNIYLKLQDQAPDIAPVSNVDFSILTVTGKFGTSALGMDTSSGKILILSKVEGWDETQLVLERFPKLRNETLMTPLWAMISNSKILLCQEADFFENLPEALLGNCLDSYPPKYLNNALIQLQSAGEFLQTHGILFLNWTVPYLSCSSDLKRVKINSLQCSLMLETIDATDVEDLVEDLLMRMSPYIAAPEMLCDEDPRVLRASAVWAYGGLVWELATGYHFHYAQRHIPREELRKKLSQDPLSHKYGSCSPHVASFVDSLCQMKPESRPKLFEPGFDMLYVLTKSSDRG